MVSAAVNTSQRMNRALIAIGCSNRSVLSGVWRDSLVLGRVLEFRRCFWYSAPDLLMKYLVELLVYVHAPIGKGIALKASLCDLLEPLTAAGLA